MKLVVISPPDIDAREPALLAEFFGAGLERYHVRKPDWTAAQLEAWLRALAPATRARCVVHAHHELVAPLGLAGAHQRDEVGTGVPPVRPDAQPAHPNFSKLPSAEFTSRSCHDLPSLRAALGHYDSVFVSPIFPSLSKPGHKPDGRLPLGDLRRLLQQRTDAERRTCVFALGGVTAANIATCADLGFDGVAALGAIWQAADPIAAFRVLSEVATSVSEWTVNPPLAHARSY